MPGTALVKFIAYAFLILTWPAAAALGYLIGASNPLALLALFAVIGFSIVSTLAFKVLRQAERYAADLPSLTEADKEELRMLEAKAAKALEDLRRLALKARGIQ